MGASGGASRVPNRHALGASRPVNGRRPRRGVAPAALGGRQPHPSRTRTRPAATSRPTGHSSGASARCPRTGTHAASPPDAGGCRLRPPARRPSNRRRSWGVRARWQQAQRIALLQPEGSQIREDVLPATQAFRRQLAGHHRAGIQPRRYPPPRRRGWQTQPESVRPPTPSSCRPRRQGAFTALVAAIQGAAAGAVGGAGRAGGGRATLRRPSAEQR